MSGKMPGADLRENFPGLSDSEWRIASPPTPTYNCIAWAAGKTDRWWWPDPLEVCYWPPAAPRSETIEAFALAYAALGYSACDSPEPEPGVEKVAIYAHAGRPKHAARQLPDGRWTSKLGRLVDIEHKLSALEGDKYGYVTTILKRPTTSTL